MFLVLVLLSVNIRWLNFFPGFANDAISHLVIKVLVEFDPNSYLRDFEFAGFIRSEPYHQLLHHQFFFLELVGFRSVSSGFLRLNVVVILLFCGASWRFSWLLSQTSRAGTVAFAVTSQTNALEWYHRVAFLVTGRLILRFILEWGSSYFQKAKHKRKLRQCWS